MTALNPHTQRATQGSATHAVPGESAVAPELETFVSLVFVDAIPTGFFFFFFFFFSFC